MKLRVGCFLKMQSRYFTNDIPSKMLVVLVGLLNSYKRDRQIGCLKTPQRVIKDVFLKP